MRKNKYKNSHKIKKVFSDVGKIFILFIRAWVKLRQSLYCHKIGCVVSADEVYKEGELLEAKDGCNEW